MNIQTLAKIDFLQIFIGFVGALVCVSGFLWIVWQMLECGVDGYRSMRHKFYANNKML